MVDLDFVIGQQSVFPVGLQRCSPAELKRSVLAAAISVLIGNKSIDYTKKKHVPNDLYEEDVCILGDRISDFIKESSIIIRKELVGMQNSDNIAAGQFGSDITLFRIPYSIDVARMLANRGLLLEVIPILRLSFEMICWACAAFKISSDDKVFELRAQNCVQKARDFYRTAGRIYGYLSQFSHWGHAIHGVFLTHDESRVGVMNASQKYRAISLSLCLLILDMLLAVLEVVYGQKAQSIIFAVQGTTSRDPRRKILCNFMLIKAECNFPEIEKIFDFFA